MKVVGPFDDLEEFTEEDVALQEKFVFEKTAKKIKERVMKMGITDERLVFIVLLTYVLLRIAELVKFPHIQTRKMCLLLRGVCA